MEGFAIFKIYTIKLCFLIDNLLRTQLKTAQMRSHLSSQKPENVLKSIHSSPSHLNLVSDGATSVHVSYLWFPGRCHIWPRAAGPTSIMASEVTRIVSPFWPPGIYSSLTQMMAPPQAILILNCEHELAQKLF